MRSMYIKPENSLQRAEELIQVNAPSEALSVLQETLLSRRARGAPIASLENVAVKFIELAVDLNRSRVAREGLHLFKNLAQNTSVSSVEKVITKFIDRSELKLAEAKQLHDTKTASALAAVASAATASDDEGVEDLDTKDTFDSMFNAMICSLDDPDSGTAAMTVAAAGSTVPTKASKRNRDSVTSRLKFLWDAYRTVLDVLRNNGRLELLYQQTVAQAFGFCLRNARKNEFRRLCETLRTHLANLPRQSAQQHNGINLSDPDILQRFLDTRFLQLQTANDMELWQESFRSVEDIYHLLVMAGSLIAPNAANIPGAMAGLLPAALFTNKRHGAKMTQMVAQYYQKLTQIFTVSEDRMFLAAAWNKYYSWVTNIRGSLSEDEQSLASAHVVLSALAAPVFSEPVDPDAHVRFNRKNRLAQMLGMAAVPDRASLLSQAGTKSILSKVPDFVCAVYNAMESDFHPLVVAEAVRPHLRMIESDPQLAKYVPHLRTVIVASVLKSISVLYSKIALPTVLDLASVDDMPLDLFTLEKVIMMGNQKREFNIKLNCLSQTLEFTTEAAVPNLDTLLEFPLYEDYIDQEKHDVFERAREMAEDEHRSFLERQAVIEDKKIATEKAAQRKIEEETKERARIANEEREALQRKMAEEAREREVARLKQEQEALKKAEARKIAEAFKAKSGLTIADEDLDSLDTNAIFAMQAEQVRTEREHLEAKMKSIVKRADYNERAIRKEEIPALHKYREEQKVLDLKLFNEARTKLVEEAKDRHAKAIAIKHRVLRMVPDFEVYQQTVQATVDERQELQNAQMNAKIEQACNERRQAVRAALRARIAAEEKRRKEEEERRIAQEAAAASFSSMREKAAKDVWVPNENVELPWKQVGSAKTATASPAAASAWRDESKPSRPSDPQRMDEAGSKYTPPKRTAVVPVPRFDDRAPAYKAPQRSSRPLMDSVSDKYSAPQRSSTPSRPLMDSVSDKYSAPQRSSTPNRPPLFRNDPAMRERQGSTPPPLPKSEASPGKYVPPSHRNKDAGKRW